MYIIGSSEQAFELGATGECQPIEVYKYCQPPPVYSGMLKIGSQKFSIVYIYAHTQN